MLPHKLEVPNSNSVLRPEISYYFYTLGIIMSFILNIFKHVICLYSHLYCILASVQK